jgi:hypothetical protein
MGTLIFESYINHDYIKEIGFYISKTLTNFDKFKK